MPHTSPFYKNTVSFFTFFIFILFFSIYLPQLISVSSFHFSIVKIFPEIASETKKADFESIHPKPADQNDIKNKICLCNSCAENYMFNPTTDIYDRLYRLKKRAIVNKGIVASASTRLDEEIKDILGNLKECDTEADSFKRLRMKPLKIVNKIYPDNR